MHDFSRRFRSGLVKLLKNSFFSALRGVTALKVGPWWAGGRGEGGEGVLLRILTLLAISTEMSTHDLHDGSDFQQTDQVFLP